MLKSDQVKRLKDLETESARLRKAIFDPTLDKLIPQLIFLCCISQRSFIDGGMIGCSDAGAVEPLKSVRESFHATASDNGG